VRQVFGTEGVHERTYDVGPRFYLTHGRFVPYGKVLFGRAVFNFPNNLRTRHSRKEPLVEALTIASIRFSTCAAKYEYQRWFPLERRWPLFRDR